MVMKRRYTKKEDIPAGKEGDYIEKDGVWILDTDESDEIATLARTVENMKGDKAKLQARLAAFDGINLDEVKALLADTQANKDKKMIAEGKIDELLAQRTEAMQKGHTETTAKLTERIEKMQSRLSKELVDNKIIIAAQKAGVKPKAMADVLLRGRGIYKLTEDAEDIAAFGSDGKPLFGKSGKPLAPEEWVSTTLFEEAEHLFEAGAGAGAPRTTDPGGKAAAHTIKRADAKNPALYEAARNEATKAGHQLQIID